MTDFVNIYTELTDIPMRKYEGYVWMSDKEYPIVLNGKEDFKLENINLNPFVIEALLYDKASNTSIMIKHNGSYIIKEYNLNSLPKNVTNEPKSYFAHRMGNFKRLNFRQIWLPEGDTNCEGMNVLKLKATVFTGFEN